MGNYLIPNNIKSEHTLVADPSLDAKTGTISIWNFGYVTSNSSTKDNTVNICPKNYFMFKDDISLGKNKYAKLFKDIPKIRIREYLMDLPEDRWLDILLQTYTDMSAKFEAWKKDPKKYKVVFNTAKLREALLQFINGAYEKTNNPKIEPSSGTDDKLWYDFVVFIYRQIISYDITHYYTLPYSGVINMGSNGSQGWKTSKLFKDGFRFISDINIDRVPMWKYEGAEGDTIQFELTLFNDTYNSACSNFRFIHTLIPNNMWLQYGMFQHNPCVYDIQFEGGLRYFCCSLDVKCENVGNSRIPRDKFYKDVCSNSNLLIKNKIRIPDAYKITFNFKSLLPNNFNQYIMSYRERDAIIDESFARHETVTKDIADVVSDALQATLFSEGGQSNMDASIGNTPQTNIEQSSYGGTAVA